LAIGHLLGWENGILFCFSAGTPCGKLAERQSYWTSTCRAPAEPDGLARAPIQFRTALIHFRLDDPMRTPQRPPRKKAKTKLRGKKKDPIFIEGKRPRPMYVDYKDLELLSKLTNRQGKIVGRRKSGCTAASQHAVTRAIKRARFMALLPYVGE
jgi:small subunit ribosomal protein S18